MEMTDGPNECDQAALGSIALLYLLHVVYVDAVKEECQSFDSFRPDI